MNTSFICPSCGHHRLVLKYEVMYEYSYILDANAPGLNNDQEFRSYVYDDRIQKLGEQYIECCACKKRHSCYLQDNGKLVFK